jgi:hypothetical protein
MQGIAASSVSASRTDERGARHRRCAGHATALGNPCLTGPSRVRRRTASQLHLGSPPATDPYHHHATEGFAKASGDHRTSFAPETIATRRNKHDRTRQILRKINASDSCPVAHNGLVGGSSPPGPTTHSRKCSSAARRFGCRYRAIKPSSAPDREVAESGAGGEGELSLDHECLFQICLSRRSVRWTVTAQGVQASGAGGTIRQTGRRDGQLPS